MRSTFSPSSRFMLAGYPSNDYRCTFESNDDGRLCLASPAALIRPVHGRADSNACCSKHRSYLESPTHQAQGEKR
jgi:hypothetical protein